MAAMGTQQSRKVIRGDDGEDCEVCPRYRPISQQVLVGWAAIVLTIILAIFTAGNWIAQRFDNSDTHQAAMDTKLDMIMGALQLRPSVKGAEPTNATMHRE